MTMEDTYLFSYGALVSPEIQKQLFGRTVDGVRDALKSYKMETMRTGDKLDVRAVPAVGHEIDGFRFHLSEAEIAQCDAYESPMKRKLLPLTSGKKAWVYL